MSYKMKSEQQNQHDH